MLVATVAACGLVRAPVAASVWPERAIFTETARETTIRFAEGEVVFRLTGTLSPMDVPMPDGPVALEVLVAHVEEVTGLEAEAGPPPSGCRAAGPTEVRFREPGAEVAPGGAGS
ncbi:MAG: hypothetical protein H6732_17400 [Alphaproteobacteria bacterium]|nr:hypothetical protein [Alphaproteobacteria bacterium]